MVRCSPQSPSDVLAAHITSGVSSFLSVCGASITLAAFYWWYDRSDNTESAKSGAFSHSADRDNVSRYRSNSSYGSDLDGDDSSVISFGTSVGDTRIGRAWPGMRGSTATTASTSDCDVLNYKSPIVDSGRVGGMYANGRDGLRFFEESIRWLALSDLMVASSMLLSNILLLWFPHAFTHWVCFVVRWVIQFFTIATFSWTTAIAIQLLVSVLSAGVLNFRKWRWMAHAVCWMLATLDVLPQVIWRETVMKLDASYWCTLSIEYSWYLWVGPMILSVFVNLACYVALSVVLFRLFGGMVAEKGTVAKLLFRLSLYLVLFVICWLPDVTSHILSLMDLCRPTWLGLLQNFFVPLQGFVNCILFSVTDPAVRFPCFNKREKDVSDAAVSPKGSNASTRLLADIQYGYEISEQDRKAATVGRMW